MQLDRLEQHFAARCRAVVRVPYDLHLDEGAEVELSRLNRATADAYLMLAQGWRRFRPPAENGPRAAPARTPPPLPLPLTSPPPSPPHPPSPLPP